jgi:uncharacterized protein
MRWRFLIILCIILIAEVYSFIVVRSLIRHMSQGWRATLFYGYLVVTVLSWVSILLVRIVHWSVLPHVVRNVCVALILGLFVGKVLILVIMLADDLRRIFSWLFRILLPNNATLHVINTSRSSFLQRSAIVLAGVSIVGFTYGLRNRYNYKVQRLKLKFASLPAAFRGLRIVQVSDIHTGSFDSYEAVAHGIQKVLDQQPDIIFFTGDLVNNRSEEVDARYQEIYSRLKAPLGVYSILGNHDYGDYVQWESVEEKINNLNRLKEIQKAMGWTLLTNEHVLLQRGADTIAVIGVENWSAKANFPKYGDMEKACAGLQQSGVSFKILLSHDPSHWDGQILPNHPDIDLMLSGHTHGMQFGVDSKWLKWSPVQYVYQQWAGLYCQGTQYLYVNRGFGFIGYPGRLGILPEITVMELV